MNTENKILLSRFLTRSGDQAWDFAVPLILIALFPENLKLAFIYFFLLRLSSTLLMPYIGRFIDEMKRIKIITLGLTIQGLSVLFTGVFLWYREVLGFNVFYTFLVVFGIFSNLAINVMDIAVANDLVPSVIKTERLVYFNSRLRQLDLLTEVFAPIAAGFLLSLSAVTNSLLGVGIIILWNLLSFIPELFILRGIVQAHPHLDELKAAALPSPQGLLTKLTQGWSTFAQSSVFWIVIANACLWLTVLSPHGVLLTAFLKAGWNIPEYIIGLFRASGAIFGLIATVVYPYFHKRMGLILSGKYFIAFQAFFVVMSFVLAFSVELSFQYLFMIAVLVSRIGLYGFGLAETELRQTLIQPRERGKVNGVSNSLTSFATVIIYGLGVVFSKPDQFIVLVGVSALSVFLGALILNTKVRGPELATTSNSK